MIEEDATLPATEDAGVSSPAPATDVGGKAEIADQLRSTLEGKEPVDSGSKRDQLRSQIDAELTKQTTAEKAAKADSQPGRQRGPDGKFLPREADAANPETDPAIAADPADPVAPALEAPGSWSKAVKEHWPNLPPEVQAEIVKREEDVKKGFDKYQSLRSVEPILDVVAQMAPRYNTTPQRVLDSWAGSQAALLNPQTAAQEVVKIAQAYLSREQIAQIAQSVIGNAPQPQPEAQPDPNVWVDPEIASLKKELDGFRSWRTELEQQAETAARQHIQAQQDQKVSAIEKFELEKDEAGQPLRPHLNVVMRDMVESISRIRSTNPQLSDQEVLQKAYEAAVWSNPDIRDKLLEAQRLAEENKRKAEAKVRAQAATRQAVSPAGVSPQGSPAPAPLKGNIRDQMQTTLAQLTGA